MDMQKTAREIGLFETGINLSKVCNSTDVIQKVGASMPLPDEDIANRIPQIVTWLQSFGKSKYMFLTPEIALIEEMSKHSKQEEIIIAIPCDLEEETKARLRNNLPRSVEITILEEPYFPQSFFPGNGLLVVCGYAADGRSMVLPDTYRMLEHYNGFLGKKVFIPYKELEIAARYDGWLEVDQRKLSTKWRSKS
jgi:hypothetical protein